MWIDTQQVPYFSNNFVVFQEVDAESKERLGLLAGRRLARSGEIVIFARAHREQERNRADARERLREMIERALHEPKIRKKSKISRAAQKKRLDQKGRDSALKTTRSKGHGQSPD